MRRENKDYYDLIPNLYTLHIVLIARLIRGVHLIVRQYIQSISCLMFHWRLGFGTIFKIQINQELKVISKINDLA